MKLTLDNFSEYVYYTRFDTYNSNMAHWNATGPNFYFLAQSH